MQKALEHLELILTAVGVAVVILVFYVFGSTNAWRAAAVCAVAVAVLHGVIFAVVRSTQRRVRGLAVVKIRHTCEDLIRNKLQVVLFSSEIQDQDWRPAAQRAVQEIQNSLVRIEAEALKSE